MSELSFEQMLEDSVKTIRNGEIVQGTVIDVKDDEIILNIGYKADGIITKNEYTNDSSVVLTDVVKPGDTMEAKVLKVNDGEGQVTLTYKRLTHMRKIFPNMQIRRLSSLSQSSTQEDAVSSVTVNSFFLLRRLRNRKSFLLRST